MVIQISEIFTGGHEVAEVASFLFAGWWGVISFKALKESLSLFSLLPTLRSFASLFWVGSKRVEAVRSPSEETVNATV